MALREVLKMGNPALRKVARPFAPEEITSPETAKLIEDMIETMEEQEGIGLAAPQIGVSRQLALVGISGGASRYRDIPEIELHVIFNPKVEILSAELYGFWEGCLSVPGLRGYVERPDKIKVSYLDQNACKCSVIAEGFIATVFQHEIDHLNGVLYIDKIVDTGKLAYLNEYAQYIESEGGEEF